MFGWLNRPEEVEKLKAKLTFKDVDHMVKTSGEMSMVSAGEPVLPYLLFRKITGADAPCGPQKIGDCVSWGWGGAGNFLQICTIAGKLKQLGTLHLLDNGEWVDDAQDHPNFNRSGEILFEYQEVCTEWIYGSSRVEIGKQRGSTEDGSVGAWAAESTATMGFASRKKYGPYDPQRAKQWGSQGVPDDYEPEAKKHPYKDVVPVTSYDQLVTMIRAYRPVPICSNQGFNETRDNKGRCQPSGRWDHCMLCFGLDEDGWPLIYQSWGTEGHPGGPRYLDQPANTFFSPPETVDRMLRQNDSFSPAGILGFQVEDLLTWVH